MAESAFFTVDITFDGPVDVLDFNPSLIVVGGAPVSSPVQSAPNVISATVTNETPTGLLWDASPGLVPGYLAEQSGTVS